MSTTFYQKKKKNKHKDKWVLPSINQILWPNMYQFIEKFSAIIYCSGSLFWPIVELDFDCLTSAKFSSSMAKNKN